MKPVLCIRKGMMVGAVEAGVHMQSGVGENKGKSGKGDDAMGAVRPTGSWVCGN